MSRLPPTIKNALSATPRSISTPSSVVVCHGTFEHGARQQVEHGGSKAFERLWFAHLHIENLLDKWSEKDVRGLQCSVQHEGDLRIGKLSRKSRVDHLAHLGLHQAVRLPVEG